MKKANWLAAVFAFMVGLGTAWSIQNIESVLEFGMLKGMLNGAPRWLVSTNSSGQLDIIENNTLDAVVFRLDGTDGSLLIRARTTAQLAALAPTAVNELIINSSTPQLCIASGTLAGAWISMSTGPTAGRPCGSAI